MQTGQNAAQWLNTKYLNFKSYLKSLVYTDFKMQNITAILNETFCEVLTLGTHLKHKNKSSEHQATVKMLLLMNLC